MRGIGPVVLAIAVGLGTVFSCLPPPSVAPEAVTQKTLPVVQQPVDLKQAFHASYALRLAQHKRGGASCTLISRVRMEGGEYKYRGLTAYHVMDNYLDELKKDPEADNTITLTSLGWDKEFEFTTQMTSDWSMPVRDWATFTFVSEHYLSCAKLSTREEFNSVGVTDDIYIVGNDSSQGVMVRKTTMARPHNRYPSHSGYQYEGSPWPWHNHPQDFFRMVSFIWYGCSGGSVFNSRGELLGMINAMAIFGGYHQDPTGFPAVALKAYVIKEMVEATTPGFFLIED